MSSVYESCLAELSDGAEPNEMLFCVARQFEEQEQARNTDLKDFLFVLAGALIFFMQTGFAMLCAGSVRIKNVQNTMLKNLLDASGAALAFWLVGYAFAFGGQDTQEGTTFIGYEGFFKLGSSPALWFFQYTFSATAVTIVAGTLAERCQMAAYLCYSVFLTGFVYPIVAHSIWSNNGFLSGANADPFLGIGVLDFAGSGVVHVTGGTTALYATMVLGPRRGRFYDAQGEPLETPKEFPGHSVALQLLGTMVLWFGWYGFNPGSALLLTVDHVGRVAATCAVTTSLAAAAGGVCALVTNLYLEERRTGEPSFNLTMCMNGALSGLVAITASCAVVEAWAAVIIGVVAGWLYIYSSALLIRVKIDDAVDAIPVHMVNGAWGLIATGFLASPRLVMEAFGSDHAVGWFYSLGRGSTDASLLANQVCALLFIVGWTFFTMFPFFIWLNYMGWLRSDSLEELVGLDISYHGGGTGSKDGGVKKEYVEAYKRQKSLKSRRSPNYDYGAAARGSHNDPEMNQEAAAQEAFNEED